MTPHAARYISEDDLALFAKIKSAVERMGDPELGLDENGEPVILSCHILARAVAKVFPARVRDGYFAGSYDHSWVETPGGHLIDVYPVAVIGGPIMFEGGGASPQRRIYTRSSAKKLSRGRFSQSSFRRSVRRATNALTDARGFDEALHFKERRRKPCPMDVMDRVRRVAWARSRIRSAASAGGSTAGCVTD